MARLISQTLLLRHTTATATATPPVPISAFLNHRHLSDSSGVKGRLIEIQLESDSFDDTTTTDTNSNKSDKKSLRLLSELVHYMTVRQSRPAWLPFIPGSSYWVPPNKKYRNYLDDDELFGTRDELSSPVDLEGSSIDSTEAEVQEPLKADLSNESKPQEEK